MKSPGRRLVRYLGISVVPLLVTAFRKRVDGHLTERALERSIQEATHG